MSETTVDSNPAGIRRGQLLVILVFATGIGLLAMNMVLPALPNMAREFGSSYNAIQYVLTVFLFALAFAQLIYGAVSDRFGRRPVMIFGLVVFLIGCIIVAVAWNLPMLLTGRIIQGAGGCVGLVLGRAILRDLFDRDRAASMLGYVTMSMVLAPMIGPALGGGFEETLGWRAGVLALMLIGGVVLTTVAIKLPETHFNRSETTGLVSQARSYAALMRDPLYLNYVAIMAFTSATFFAFLGGAPYIVIELMGRGPGEFGLWAMMIAFGYMVGNFVTGRYALRIGTRKMMRYGVTICLLSAITLLGMAVYGPNVPIALFGPMMLVTFANGLVMASAVTSSVSVRPDLAGAASGFGGFVQIGTGAMATVAVGIVHNGTAIPLTMIIAASSSLALIAFMLVLRHPDPVEAPIG